MAIYAELKDEKALLLTLAAKIYASQTVKYSLNAPQKIEQYQFDTFDIWLKDRGKTLIVKDKAGNIILDKSYEVPNIEIEEHMFYTARYELLKNFWHALDDRLDMAKYGQETTKRATKEFKKQRQADAALIATVLQKVKSL